MWKSIISLSFLSFNTLLLNGQEVIFCNEKAEFFTLNTDDCEYSLLFQVEFPPAFTQEERFITGFTITKAHRFFAVNGYHLMEIDPSTGQVIDILDSISLASNQVHRWVSITSNDQNLLYLGTMGLYVYDLISNKIVKRPVFENDWLHYFGGDLTWHDGHIVNYNKFLRVIETIDPLTSQIIRSIPTDFNNDFFGLTYTFTPCSGSDLFGLRADYDTSILFRIDLEAGQYDTICHIVEPNCFGLSSFSRLDTSNSSVSSGKKITYDTELFSTTSTAHCGVENKLFDFVISTCQSIDSILFDVPSYFKWIDPPVFMERDGLFCWKVDDMSSHSLTEILSRQIFLVEDSSMPTASIFITLFYADRTTKIEVTIMIDPNSCLPSNGYRFYFPNAFSPNGDGVNDQYKVSLVNAEELKSFRVYSRWGELIFQQNKGPNIFWEGIDALPGIYLFLAEISNADHSAILHSGTITLIK